MKAKKKSQSENDKKVAKDMAELDKLEGKDNKDKPVKKSVPKKEKDKVE